MFILCWMYQGWRIAGESRNLLQQIACLPVKAFGRRRCQERRSDWPKVWCCLVVLVVFFKFPLPYYGICLPTVVSGLQPFSSTNTDEAARLSSLMKTTASILFAIPLSILTIPKVLKNAEGGSRSWGWSCKGLRGISWPEMLAQKGSATALRQVLGSYDWAHSSRNQRRKNRYMVYFNKSGLRIYRVVWTWGRTKERRRVRQSG